MSSILCKPLSKSSIVFLSIEIQVVILKYSFNNVKNNKTYRRLKKNFRVRRDYVEI